MYKELLTYSLMESVKFVGGKEASRILGVHQRTLYLWEKKGEIETIRTSGNKRLYNIEKYLKNHKCSNSEEQEVCNNLDDLDSKETKLNICYVRVSSSSQKDDLERQKDLMKAKYKDYTVIEDIGSGLNLNKRGINKIIHLAIKGKINEVVVAYKDRLTRFGFELIEDIIEKYSNGKITVLNKRQTTDPHEELVKDVMAIMNIYVAKMNGLRRYKNKDKPKETNVNIEINDK
jgi:predicted site-specific integrase-resolvase